MSRPRARWRRRRWPGRVIEASRVVPAVMSRTKTSCRPRRRRRDRAASKLSNTTFVPSPLIAGRVGGLTVPRRVDGDADRRPGGEVVAEHVARGVRVAGDEVGGVGDEADVAAVRRDVGALRERRGGGARAGVTEAIVVVCASWLRT